MRSRVFPVPATLPTRCLEVGCVTGSPGRVLPDMPVFGFHCSHEQIHPSALLAAVPAAEEAGFDAAMSSDHFSPWSARQGQSGVRLVLAGRRAAGDVAAVRRGQRARASATTRRSSRRRSAPSARCTRAGSGPRWAPARPATSTSPATAGRARTSATPGCASASTSSGRCSRGEEVSHDGLVTRRPRHGLDPAGRAAAADRRRGQRGDGRWCAEWADGLITVNAPVEHLRRDDRRLPRRRRARRPLPCRCT